MSTLDAFRNEVEAFLSETGMRPTRLGVEALRDPKFVTDLRNGRAPSMTTADRIRRFMADNRKRASEAAA